MATTIPSRKAKFTTPGWRIALTILGILLVLYGLSSPMLQLIGTEVSAQVTNIQQQGKYNEKTLTGGTGTVKVEYTFSLPNGESISSQSVYSSKVDYSDPDNVAKLQTIPVYYLSFWPQINRPAVLTGFAADAIAISVVGALLIVLINLRAARHKARQVNQSN